MHRAPNIEADGATTGPTLTAPVTRYSSGARWLALMAPVGALLFTVAWLVLGFVSPGYRLFDLVIEPYSPVSQPISGLGLGDTAPWMNAAFIVSGLLIAGGVVGVSRGWPPGERPRSRTASLRLLACGGIGMIVDGVFTLEDVMLHLVGFVLAVAFPLVGFVVAAYALRPTERGLSTWLGIAGPLTLALFVAFMVIFDPYAAGDNAGVAGLVQRALVTVLVGTFALLGWTIWRRDPVRMRAR